VHSHGFVFPSWFTPFGVVFHPFFIFTRVGFLLPPAHLPFFSLVLPFEPKNPPTNGIPCIVPLPPTFPPPKFFWLFLFPIPPNFVQSSPDLSFFVPPPLLPDHYLLPSPTGLTFSASYCLPSRPSSSFFVCCFLGGSGFSPLSCWVLPSRHIPPPCYLSLANLFVTLLSSCYTRGFQLPP